MNSSREKNINKNKIIVFKNAVSTLIKNNIQIIKINSRWLSKKTKFTLISYQILAQSNYLKCVVILEIFLLQKKS